MNSRLSCFRVLKGCHLQHPRRAKAVANLIAKLEKEFSSPEHVDGQRPPSHRIREVIPEYQKSVTGSLAAAAIGLDALRKRCLHFGQWLDWIAKLAPAPV